MGLERCPALNATIAEINVKELYAQSGKEPSIVDVPAMQFLMVDGTGNDNQAARVHHEERIPACGQASRDLSRRPAAFSPGAAEDVDPPADRG